MSEAKRWRDESARYALRSPESYLTGLPSLRWLPAHPDPYGDVHRRIGISADDLERMDEYSASVPTGVYLRKCWKRAVGDRWQIGWYGWGDRPGTYSTNFRWLEVVVEASYFLMCSACIDPRKPGIRLVYTNARDGSRVCAQCGSPA